MQISTSLIKDQQRGGGKILITVNFKNYPKKLINDKTADYLKQI